MSSCLANGTSPSAAVVKDLLQRDAHPPVPEQGCAIAAHGSADRPDFQRADLGRAPSSIWPDVISDRHKDAAAPRIASTCSASYQRLAMATATSGLFNTSAEISSIFPLLEPAE